MVTHDSKSDLPLAILLEHMHKKFEINRIKIKGGCQLGRKGVTHNSKSELPLARIGLGPVMLVKLIPTFDVFMSYTREPPKQKYSVASNTKKGNTVR